MANKLRGHKSNNRNTTIIIFFITSTSRKILSYQALVTIEILIRKENKTNKNPSLKNYRK